MTDAVIHWQSLLEIASTVMAIVHVTASVAKKYVIHKTQALSGVYRENIIRP